MKKTARRYTRLQLFVRKLIPSFFISLIIVSIITAWASAVWVRSMENFEDYLGDTVSERIYSFFQRSENNASPDEDVMVKNYLDFVMTLYSGGADPDSEYIDQSFVILCDSETNQIAAGPQSNIYLVNTDGKNIPEIYKADESAAEKLLEIREKYPDSGFKVRAAYTGEDGKFIPEKVEIVTGDTINGTVDFSDTDKKEYKYTELKENANIQFMLFKGYAGDITELSEKIVSEIRLINPENALKNMFDPEISYKKMNIRIGDRNYFLVYGTDELQLFKSVFSFEGLISFLLKVFVLTLICAFIWSLEKYRELKVYYDSEDFRKELTNTMAHDLKTPLMAASGYAENLLNGTNPEKNDHYAQALLENINYMNNIITDVLELSKLESGSDILRLTSVSVRPLAEDICKRSADIISAKNLSLNIEGECTVKADEALMKRALENLILNAVKYSDEGSVIKVSLSENRLTVENRYSGEEINDANSLLKPFVKGDRSRSSKKGSGLGLSIVKNITDMHGFRFNISAADNVFRAEIRLGK